MKKLKERLDEFVLPLVGILAGVILWHLIAGKPTARTVKDDWGDTVTVTKREGLSADLPSPGETWKASKLYITDPMAKRGELDQGILAFTWLSLKLVAQGY